MEYKDLATRNSIQALHDRRGRSFGFIRDVHRHGVSSHELPSVPGFRASRMRHLSSSCQSTTLNHVSSLIIILVAVAFLGLSSCTQPPAYKPYELMESDPIVQADFDDVFIITWFQQPFSGSYYRIILHTDGSIEHSRIGASLAIQAARLGQLTEEEKKEVQITLKTLSEKLPTKEFEGTRVITLSFPWSKEIRVLSFSELRCPDGLHSLLEIADAAFRRSPKFSSMFQNPCKENSYRH